MTMNTNIEVEVSELTKTYAIGRLGVHIVGA